MDLPAIRRSYADAEPRPFWLAQAGAPDLRAPLEGEREADLVVVGGGLTGLWTALLAREHQPQPEVVLLEGERIAFGASGRNGGFMDASLTHGVENGVARWPGEMPELERLGRENFAAIRHTLARRGIDAGFEETGELAFATAPYQAEYIAEAVEIARSYGWTAEALDAEQARAEVHSPTYHGAAFLPEGLAVVDPARLAWGLAEAAHDAGAHLHERSPVTRLERDGLGVIARTPSGRVRARRAVLATSAFPPLVRAIRRYVVPVWDYVLVTEPLSARQRESVGWRKRQGLTDLANQFPVYAVGYTGLGVAASRFGAQVALDLAAGRETERTRLKMVGSKPIPFPPEPLRWGAITVTRRALAKADRNEGRRGPWLRTLDRLGLGFDS